MAWAEESKANREHWNQWCKSYLASINSLGAVQPYKMHPRSGPNPDICGVLLYSNMAYAGGYNTWPESMLDGMLDIQKAVLEPPYHIRLKRPVLNDDGILATEA
ncbi:uncharacterized protein METZ01_LOCUS350650 [marine metagenome]|jgi:hypothetical protein|uniref:Uncharacterized protein n=1 Tax=marine metagenome TaxID=408172 RepID=A0A382RJJ3_9ZZZZ|tara:strand:+ start:35 stop:346 length:312 start_codon:yes stop_codon:yes gene_type:complete